MSVSNINRSQTRECEIGIEAAQFTDKEYINGIFVAVYWQTKLKIKFPPFPTSSLLSLYNGDTLAPCQDILWLFSM